MGAWKKTSLIRRRGLDNRPAFEYVRNCVNLPTTLFVPLQLVGYPEEHSILKRRRSIVTTQDALHRSSCDNRLARASGCRKADNLLSASRAPHQPGAP